MASKLTVKKNLIQARFCGIGFHNSEAGMYKDMSDVQFNQVVGKIFRDLKPGFSRIWGGAPTWTQQDMDNFAEYYGKMHGVTGTDVYLTGSTRRYYTEEEKLQYAKDVADRLEYLLYEKKLDRIKFYCMSNELSLDSWGDLYFELPTFKEYHTYLYKEFSRRHLPVKLLATDASPYERWDSIGWAIEHGMVPISGIFGAHHYVNDFDPEDIDFYKWFHRHVKGVVNQLNNHERRFILGEFGLAQDMRNINGVKMDVCKYFYNDQEAYSALAISEMALAAMNAGAYAEALWTFTDYPNPTETAFRYNKWGLTRWDGTDYSPRDWLYAIGLMVKYFKKESKPMSLTTEDYLLRCGGVSNDDGSFSFMIINRHEKPTDIKINLEDLPLDKPLRRFTYDSANVQRNPFGDLQPYDDVIDISGGMLTCKVPGNSIVMFTTDYQCHKPAAITGVKAENGKVTWDASSEAEHCYYRVYKGGTADFTPCLANQVASTIETYYNDPCSCPGFYKVQSVDQWDNE